MLANAKRIPGTAKCTGEGREIPLNQFALLGRIFAIGTDCAVRFGATLLSPATFANDELMWEQNAFGFFFCKVHVGKQEPRARHSHLTTGNLYR